MKKGDLYTGIKTLVHTCKSKLLLWPYEKLHGKWSVI